MVLKIDIFSDSNVIRVVKNNILKNCMGDAEVKHS